MGRSRLALILTAVITLPVCAFAQSEQRCTDLGAGCLCSETFNVNANLPAEPDRYWNPPNSTTKECGGPGSGTFHQEATMTMPSDYSGSAQVLASTLALFPSGANPYVYRGVLNGVHQAEGDAPTLNSGETLCFRAYRAYSADSGTLNPGLNQRIKNIGLESIATGHWDLQHDPGSSTGGGLMQMSANAWSAPDHGNYFGDFHDRCKGNWCRIELCADLTGNHLFYRGRINYFSTAEQQDFAEDAGTGPTSSTFNASYVYLYVQNGPITGFQFLSHEMMAKVAYDPTFWIGPASELEGTGGPPPAPHLFSLGALTLQGLVRIQ